MNGHHFTKPHFPLLLYFTSKGSANDFANHPEFVQLAIYILVLVTADVTSKLIEVPNVLNTFVVHNSLVTDKLCPTNVHNFDFCY